MDGMGNIILIVALGLVLAVLVVGVVAMLKGGEFNRKYGNKLMRMRVLLQGAALLVLLLLFFVG